MAVIHLNGREEVSVVCCTTGKTLLTTTLLGEITCKRCLKIVNTHPVVEVTDEEVANPPVEEYGSEIDNQENLDELDSLDDESEIDNQENLDELDSLDDESEIE